MNRDTQQDQRISVITGGSKGIGKATAMCLAEQGDRVIITARSQEECDETASQIVKQGGSAIGIAADVGHLDSMTALASEIGEHYGRLDSAFLNAGAIWGGAYRFMKHRWTSSTR